MVYISKCTMYDIIDAFSNLALLTGIAVFILTFLHIVYIVPFAIERIKNFSIISFLSGKSEEDDEHAGLFGKIEQEDRSRTLHKSILAVSGESATIMAENLRSKLKYDDTLSFASTVEYDEQFAISETDESLVFLGPVDVNEPGSKSSNLSQSALSDKDIIDDFNLDNARLTSYEDVEESIDIGNINGFNQLVDMRKTGILKIVRENLILTDNKSPLGFTLEKKKYVDPENESGLPMIAFLYVASVVEGSEADRTGIRVGSTLTFANMIPAKTLINEWGSCKKILDERPLTLSFITCYGK